ncbi:HAMP domain-containing sensor histidine kinase [Myroides sp. LJL116]
MNLRKRLTIYSTTIFGVVFFICALLILVAFYRSSTNIIYKELKNDALLTAFYYLEKDELPLKEHWLISKEFEQNIKRNKIVIYNSKDAIAYGNTVADQNITPKILESIRQKKSLDFKIENNFYQGIFYPDNQGDFVVITTATTTNFNGQINSLLLILLFVFLTGLLAIYFVSIYISNVAYRPLKQIVKKVNQISYTNLDTPIEVPNSKDELASLISSYNGLLNRVAQSISNQKNFINYASHEFKSPLTAISGNLEVFAQRPRSQQEYQQMAKNVLDSVYKIENILNNLLLLSSLEVREYTKTPVRVDEILWKVHQSIASKTKAIILVEILVEDFSDLKLMANETLLELALFNLVDNAVKYGQDKPVELRLFKQEDRLCLKITDKGKGIPEAEIPLITNIFYRSAQNSHLPGSGIGLTLTCAILQLHNIDFSLESTLDKGTEITLLF